MDDRTKEMIGRYLAGELDDVQCADVERLAAQDAEVAKAIEDGLAPVARAFRAAFPVVDQPHPDRGIPKFARPSFARVWRPLAAAAVLIATAFLLWPKQPTLTLVSTVGTVTVDGRRIVPGNQVPVGSRVITTGPAQFRLGSVTVMSDPLVGCFATSLVDGELKLEDHVGEITFDGPSERNKYLVGVGGYDVRPLGTRFLVSSPSREWLGLSVFEDKVEVRKNGHRYEVSEGATSWTMNGYDLVAEDFNAIQVGGAMKVPSRSGLIEKRRRPLKPLPNELQRELDDTVSSKGRSTAEKYWVMSLAMARFEEPVASAHLATAALDAGLDASSLADSDIWALLRRSARKDCDGRLALRLLDVLESKGTPVKELDPYRALIESWKFFGDRGGQMRIDAAKAIRALNRSEDAMLVAEGLTFGYQEHQDDKRHLEDALTLLRPIANDPSVPVRSRAFAFQRTGEATFFLGPKKDSVALTMRAVELWPRPRWKVHVGTRMAECDAASLDEALTWIAEGLVEEPTYYAYERAAVAIHAGATVKSDFAVLKDLLTYTGKTFRSIPLAQAHMAQWIMLSFGDVDGPAPIMDRAVLLYGGWSGVPSGLRNDIAAAFAFAGRKEEGRRIALDPYASTDDRDLWPFYQHIGEYGLALACFNRIPLEDRTDDFHLNVAALLRGAGRNSEAIEEYRAYAATEREHLAHFGRWKEIGNIALALVSLAELSPDVAESRRFASETLDVLRKQEEMSVTGKANRTTLEARARFVLGEKGRAVKIVKDYLDGPRTMGEQRLARALLRQMAP